MRDGADQAAARHPGARRWRPGLVDRYLIRSLAGPFALALAVALFAMLLDRALSLAGEMAVSGADFHYFLPLLAWLVPGQFGLAMPVALMIALMFLVSRLDETVELEAMLAIGLSFNRIAAPLVAFALLVGAAGLAGTGWLDAIGRYQFRMLKAEALHAGDVRNLQPGAFYAPVAGLTFSFEHRLADGGVGPLFVRRDLGGGRELVATAPSGRLGRDRAGMLELGLSDGLWFEDGDPRRRTGAYGLQFAQAAIRDGRFLYRAVRPRGADAKELDLVELAGEASGGARGFAPAAVRGEFYARLARPLSVLLLPLLAIPLGFAAKKGRRGFGIAIGAALVVGYHHLVNLAKDVTSDGSPAPGLAFLLLCAAFGAGVIGLFAASRKLPSHSPVTLLLDRFGLGGHGVPSGGGARIGGTIGAYLAANYALWTAAAAAALILILQMADLLERTDDFVARQFGLVDVARYVLLRLPLLLLQALPVAALVGAMVEMLRLSRFSEMLAIRAAGISLPRIVLMMAPVALCLALIGFALADWAAPASERAFADWWRKAAPAGKPAEDRWFRIGGEIVHAREWRDGRLVGLTVYRLSAGRLSERVQAAAASPVPGGWRLGGAIRAAIGSGPARARRIGPALWRTPLVARDAAAIFAPALVVSSEDARRALDGRRPLASGTAPFRTRLDRRFAAPLAPLIMLLLAAPLALGRGQQSVPAARLLVPIALGLGYIVVDGVLAVAAETGMVPPMLGAWLAPALFGLIALTLLVYAEA